MTPWSSSFCAYIIINNYCCACIIINNFYIAHRAQYALELYGHSLPAPINNSFCAYIIINNYYCAYVIINNYYIAPRAQDALELYSRRAAQLDATIQVGGPGRLTSI